MKTLAKKIRATLLPTYDPSRTNIAGAIAVGIAILLISQVAR